MLDVEGYEWPILKQLHSSDIKPEVIFFEAHHMSIHERTECFNMLSDKGYFTFNKGFDVVAHLKKDELSKMRAHQNYHRLS